MSQLRTQEKQHFQSVATWYTYTSYCTRMGLSLAKSFAAALLRACKSMASTAGGMNTCVWLGGDPRVALGVKTASCHTCCGISLDGIYDCHVSIFAWEYIEIYRAGIDRYHFGNVLFFRPDERMDGASFRGKPMGWH